MRNNDKDTRYDLKTQQQFAIKIISVVKIKM